MLFLCRRHPKIVHWTNPKFFGRFLCVFSPSHTFYLLIVATLLRLCYLLNAPRALSCSLIGWQPSQPAGGGRGSDAATARSGGQRRLSAGVWALRTSSHNSGGLIRPVWSSRTVFDWSLDLQAGPAGTLITSHCGNTTFVWQLMCTWACTWCVWSYTFLHNQTTFQG